MASDTRNVKLGVCQVIFDGEDLGYTKGGVEVTVTTETHKVEVDQFGKTPIAENIEGRTVTAKVPMAETTVENMARIMPGATLTVTGGAAATGTMTIATNPSDGDTIFVNGVAVTFKTVPVGALDCEIGADDDETAANLAALLQNSTNVFIDRANYAAALNVVTVTYGDKAAAGNDFTIATGTAAAKVTMSGAKLTGGSDPSSKFVVVTDGIGTNLLDIAKSLRFHPVGKPQNDVFDDFVIPLAATPGALNFAYRVDEERVFDVEFTGYPDPATRELFSVGR